MWRVLTVSFLTSVLSVDWADRDGHDRVDVEVHIDFKNVTRVSQTTTTLQVVSNPILDRTLTAPNGATFINPIHDTAWASLAALEADLVRYVPWYTYPKASVAELDAPVKGKDTSWNFTHIFPMLEDFMNAVYARNHTTVLNFATQPCWLFGTADNKEQDCSYPDNPDESFFAYLRGNRSNLLHPSGKDLARYYARLMAFLVHGRFTDEHGVNHTGGPAYKDYNRANGHVWEVFNEVDHEHDYTVDQYIHDYDVVVKEMIWAVGGFDNAPAFMGIGGASSSWVTPFLDHTKHPFTKEAPIDYISLHFYAGCSNRTNTSTYTEGFFGNARKFVEDMKINIANRDGSSFPQAKFALNEIGVVMPGDNHESLGIDADLPDIYWNAAGAMYAYLFTALAPLGVEVLGQSQLAGSPKIPEWGIPRPQYPSASLLDWRTGLGNARYWVLKLLIEEFAPGDSLVATGVTGVNETEFPTFRPLSALAAIKADGSQKILLVNHLERQQIISFSGVEDGELALKIVDPYSVQVASPDGIRHDLSKVSENLILEPFAVIVASRSNSSDSPGPWFSFSLRARESESKSDPKNHMIKTPGETTKVSLYHALSATAFDYM